MATSNKNLHLTDDERRIIQCGIENISSKKLNVNKISMDFLAKIWYNIFVRLRELRKQKELFIKCLLDKSTKICYNNNRDKERAVVKYDDTRRNY